MLSASHRYVVVCKAHLHRWRATLQSQHMRLLAFAWVTSKKRRQRCADAFDAWQHRARISDVIILLTHRRRHRRKLHALFAWWLNACLQSAEAIVTIRRERSQLVGTLFHWRDEASRIATDRHLRIHRRAVVAFRALRSGEAC